MHRAERNNRFIEGDTRKEDAAFALFKTDISAFRRMTYCDIESLEADASIFRGFRALAKLIRTRSPQREISPTRVLTPSHITVMSLIRLDIFVRFFYTSLPPMKRTICI